MRGFISYSHRDRKVVEELEIQLGPIGVPFWRDRRINAGDEWDKTIKDELERANVILLCVSGYFLHSVYIGRVEMKEARRRHFDRTALVIPIIVRDCLWEKIPLLKKLQATPTGGKAVDKWPRRNLAIVDAARSIDASIRDFKKLGTP